MNRQIRRMIGIAVLLIFSAGFAQAQRLPHTVVPEHYTLQLTPDFQSNKFAGEETIEVRILKATSSITLNALDITFEKVTVSANGVDQAAEVANDSAAQTATFSVAKMLGPGEARIHIVYTGILNNKLEGFYLAHADHRPYAVTQFEATSAREAFPCFDEPAFKATFALSVVAPEGDTAISNGRVISDESGPKPGQHTLKFSTTPKMSSYLVALTVGKYQYVEGTANGIPVRIWFTADKNKALGEFALQAAEQFLNYYDHYFTVKYPYGKLDIVAVPDFAAGAMENTAAIFGRESLLLIDPRKASFGAKNEVAQVIAHEMAHMWFGDLVTMQWWNDIWLNEGFATWMEYKAVEAWKPAWHLQQSEAESAAFAMDADSLQNTRPIRAHQAQTPGEINQLFDAIAYQKTAAVLRMLEAYLGPQVFRAGINAYIGKYQYANATAPDLWDALAAVSDKPVNQIMTTFVNQPGVPLVSGQVECHNGTTTVTLSQRRYYFNRSLFEAGSDQLWEIPVCMKWSSPTGAATHCVLLKTQRATFTLPKCASWVFLNAEARGYYRSGYGSAALREVDGVAEQDLDPAERIRLLGDEWALVRVGRDSIGDFLQLAGALKNDQTSAVMQVLGGRLAYIGRHLVNDSDRPQFQAWVRDLLQPLAQELGWQPAANESQQRRTLRATVIGILGETGRDPAVLAEAGKLAQRYMQDPSSVDPDLVGTVLSLAAVNGNASLYDEYLAHAKSAHSPEDYYRYLYALADFRDTSLVKQTLEDALSPAVRSQDMASLISAVMGNPAGRDLAWDFVRQHWLQLANKSPVYGSVGLIYSTGVFCSEKRLDEVKQFFTQHPVQGGERPFEQSLETIRYCVDLKSQQESQLAAWLGGQKIRYGQ